MIKSKDGNVELDLETGALEMAKAALKNNPVIPENKTNERISNLEGQVSSLTQMVNSLSIRIADAEGMLAHLNNHQKV